MSAPALTRPSSVPQVAWREFGIRHKRRLISSLRPGTFTVVSSTGTPLFTGPYFVAEQVNWEHSGSSIGYAK